MNELKLILQCQKNNPEAFDELYKLFGSKALKTAFLITGNKNIAEDVVQEAFIECYRDIRKLNKPELFHVWFNRLLVRICWRMAKKERKSACSNLDDYQNKENNEPHADELVEKTIMHEKLREAIQKLSQPLRTTLILYYFNELSISEISLVLNCFQGTVKSRLHNARKELSRQLKSDFLEDSSSDTFLFKKEGISDVKDFTI